MKRPKILIEPNFSRFRSTLLLQERWKRPPQFDFWVHDEHMGLVLGRKAVTGADWCEFFKLMGYDFVHAPLLTPESEISEMHNKEKSGTGSASFGSEDGIINSLEQFRARRWSWQPVLDGDFSHPRTSWTLGLLDGMLGSLPPNMKLGLHVADIFTNAWQLVGFNQFCLLSLEEPEFIHALMDSIGESCIALLKEGLRRAGDAVGFLFYSDDIAYTEGLMLGPGFCREFLFPWMAKIAAIGREHGLPFVYHSDGKLFDVFPDLIALGVNGIQPLEPKSMDPLEIRKRWPGKLCLMGNVDLDLMSRGGLDAADREVRHKIDRLGAEGGYCCGISNTVPAYVSAENYARMVEIIHSYPLERLP